MKMQVAKELEQYSLISGEQAFNEEALTQWVSSHIVKLSFKALLTKVSLKFNKQTTSV